MSKLLLPFSWLYGIIVWLRNWCYDSGIFKVTKVSVPVISVGNMTAGGTGKTPMVEYLVRYYSDKGKRVAVLSRGYKRQSEGTVAIGAGETNRGTAETLGDEPFQIARKFPNATVIVEKKRIHSAKLAIEKYKAEIIILDDGFQHRALARDIDIVMMNDRPLEEIPMLPAGLRREPMHSLQRATVAALPSDAKSGTRFLSCPIINVATEPQRLQQVFGDKILDLVSLREKRCVLFSGIANPERFQKSVQALGLIVQEFIRFPDHHSFTVSDIQRIKQAFQQHQPELIITTEKDSVRLFSTPDAGTILAGRLYYLAIEVQVTGGKAEFHKLLDSII